ncbi:hypothetical protein L207DRAFT_586498 [Hyaloscypha variabilis F]|uniref:Uncharacterized protein n=1 Tax=Hyaloscypha variabilis (strain UAMH 11265 / GT02V1 / F) TaxID=1149755 RepID=A0A2J6RE65_HYAVF|nr:hypothetical protein L207DRAFT_586498 [Hyaloscypha variabilis F]
MIFEHCLRDSWDGKLSELLVALKGSETLYVQALEIFRKVNAGLLYEGARGELENMKENPLSGIKTLVVERKKLLDPKMITFGNYTDFVTVHLKLFRDRVEALGKELKLLSWICPIL